MSKIDKKYKVVDTKTLQLGRFLIRLDTVDKDRKRYPYSYIEQKDSVGVLAYDGDRVILIRQYRHSINSYEYEIPGGGIEEGENPVAVAKREMLEETGYAIDSIEELGSYFPSPGSSNEICYLYVAHCHKDREPELEPLEYISVELFSESEFLEMIRNNGFKHSMGLVAWLRYSMKRGKL